MAFCLRTVHPVVPKSASLTLPNCKRTSSFINDPSRVLKNIQWLAFTSPSSHTGCQHHHGQKCHHRTLTGEHNLQHNFKQSSLPANWNSVGLTPWVNTSHRVAVCLSDLYEHDPLAILLNSTVQLYCGNILNQQRKNEQQQVAPDVSLKYDTKYVSFTDELYLHSQDMHVRSNLCVVLPCLKTSLPHSSAPYTSHIHSPNCSVSLSKKLSSLMCSPPVPKPDTGKAIPLNSSRLPDPLGHPSPEQVHRVHNELVEMLPNLFSRPPDYRIYDKNIIFENRIRGTKTVGLNWYIVQMSLLKILGHMKYAHVRFDIIKITQHPEEGTVKVRWRIKGVQSMQGITGLWKANKWSVSELQQGDSSNWYDGFSTFYVNSSGLVCRHVADNMMPDDEKLVVSRKASISSRLGVMLGLFPKAAHGSAIQSLTDIC